MSNLKCNTKTFVINHQQLPVAVNKVKNARQLTIDDWNILNKYISNLCKRFFKTRYFDTENHNYVDRLVEFFCKFIKCKDNELKDSAYIIAKFRFILPDVLFYLKLKENGCDLYSSKEFSVSDYDQRSLLSRLRQVYYISNKVKLQGKDINNRNMLIEYLNMTETSPTFNTVVEFLWLLSNYRSLFLGKQEIEKYFTKSELLSIGEM